MHPCNLGRHGDGLPHFEIGKPDQGELVFGGEQLEAAVMAGTASAVSVGIWRALSSVNIQDGSRG